MKLFKCDSIFCWVTLFLAVCLTNCTEQGFRIQGRIDGLKDGMVILRTINREKPRVLDSAYVENGSFVLTGVVKSPIMTSLSFQPDGQWASLFLENSEIEIKGGVEENDSRSINMRVTGSSVNRELKRMNSFVYDTLTAELEQYEKAYQQVSDLKRKRQLEIRLDSLRSNFRTSVSKRRRTFIRNNKESVIALYALAFEMSYNDEGVNKLAELLSGLDGAARKSVYYKQAKEKLEILQQLQPGSRAPGFMLSDINGNSVSLEALEGKVVLVDFWASWCVPCLESFPHLKELYSAYHEKGFEIVGISVDEDRQAWLEAVENEQLPWVNVHSFFPAANQEQNMEKRYAVNHYPKTYLIDSEGKVVAKDVRHTEIEVYLENIFSLGE